MKNDTLTPVNPDRSHTAPEKLAVDAHVHRTRAVAALSAQSRAKLAPATPLELSQQQLEVEENPKLRAAAKP